jgi:ribosomal protein S21
MKSNLVGIRVVVGDGESVAEALVRFEQLRYFVYRRPWTKRRYGYFEKPSVVRRREQRLRTMRRLGWGWYHRFPIELDAQLRRTGPGNKIGE